MNTLSSALTLKKFRTFFECAELELQISEQWGSNSPDHRLKIRKHLLTNICATGGAENSVNLLNLKRIPQLAAKKLSISHCPELGVVVLAPRPIGVDIENIPRIKDFLAQRISTAQEFFAAPTAASLWVAKESAYKALWSYQQPKTMSQLEMGNWQKLDSQSETFELLNHINFHAPFGKGLVIRNNIHALSIFAFHA